MSTEPSLEARLQRALAGDSQVLGWIYDRFAPNLYRKLGQRFPNLEASDLLQDTFVYLLGQDGKVLRRYLSREDGDSESSFAAFLWSAACGIASNRRRSRARHPTTPLQSVAEPTDGAAREAPALARDLLRRLGRCLRRRADRCYLYFQLRYRDGLTPTEVAKVTGWSQRSVYKLKQALDRALRLCLDELGVPAP